MTNQRQLSGEIVIKELDKFPNTPTRTLARKIYKENPEVFTNVETVRTAIRYYRGSNGDSHRQIISTKKYFKQGSTNPFNLPDSEAEDNDPFYLPKSATRILVLSDIHFPYHDFEALELALQHGKDHKANTILLNGDILDFYQLSRFNKDPRQRDFANELEIGKQFLQSLQKNFKCPIYWKLGNHEERYESYLFVKAPELVGVAEYELQHLLHFGEYGATLIKDKRIIYAGRLPIVHGHEFHSKAVGQVNPARSLFLKTNRSALVGHSHRTSEHSETDITGKLMTTQSTGCLCGLAPEYARINKWNHGFAFLEVDGQDYVLDNLRIYKGHIF